MSEIFARAGAPGELAAPPRLASVSALRPERGGRRYTTLVAAAAAGLIGLGAGALVMHTPPPAAQPARVAQTQPPPRTQPPTVVARAALPPIDMSLPVVEVPVRPEPQPKAKAVAAPASKLELKPAQVRTATRREAPPMAQPASCERNAVGPGCRQAVVQADRHLRNVYQTAIRRGVSRAVLTDYRDRWADLRERDTDDPAHLIQGYGALAYDLGREARDDEERAVRRRDPSGLKALAAALTPWW